MGLAMGSTLRPILSQYIVDDMIVALPADGIDEIVDKFNNYDQFIKVTVEWKKKTQSHF